MSTISSVKRTKVLPLSYVKNLPMVFAPTFYEKATSVLSACGEASLANFIANFDMQAQAFLADMEKLAVSPSEEVVSEFQRIQRLWRGVKKLFRAYSSSYNANEAVLAQKALALYEKCDSQSTFKRTNASAMVYNLVNSISDSWSTAELQGSFLQAWQTDLTTAANNYANIYQRRIESASQRAFFIDRRDQVFRAFEIAYLGLYAFALDTSDQGALDIFAELNELIVTYTSVSKARRTRISNRNQAAAAEAEAQGSDSNSDTEVADSADASAADSDTAADTVTDTAVPEQSQGETVVDAAANGVANEGTLYGYNGYAVDDYEDDDSKVVVN
ncbi:MAG: hypothetical protein Q4D14_04730 [Bacteroidales bacterium]|nr:hypothetical protein [Bacteroidales bacterium]